MLPLSVLSLALLGGFIFVTQWYPTRYYTLRSEGYRLVFLAAIFGVAFLFLASLFIEVMPTLISKCISALWKRFILPTPLEGLGRATIAFLLGAFLWWPSNKYLSKWTPSNQRLSRWILRLSNEEAIRRAIENKKDPLETFLYDALYHPSRARQIMLTVKNGKVYVGVLREIFNPAFPITSLGMVLSRSGHREASNQRMEIDVDYAQALRDRLLPPLVQSRLEELRREKPSMQEEDRIQTVRSELSSTQDDNALLQTLRTQMEQELKNYQVIIPLSEVQSANFFDETVHEDYRRVFRPQFPIEGYDELTVEEVSARLDALSAEDLRKVRDYEERNKNRKTILEQMDRRIRSSS
jgi:hypothetical protein